jgi:LmbE family N-acetylglucosaminyl deacetylase
MGLGPVEQPTVNLPTPRCVLAVGAHPDDIEFGCGATLAKWASAGAELHHLILTDGAKGTMDPDHDPMSLVAQRQEEQRAAAQILGGGHVAFLGWPDGELRNGIREQWEVCRWIRELRPDVVLGHDPWRPYQLDPDHRHGGFITVDALMAARLPKFFAEQGLAVHRPDALLLWDAGEPNHVEDVTGFEDVKVRALLAHRSQHRATLGLTDPPGTAPSNEALVELTGRIVDRLEADASATPFAVGEQFHLVNEP